MSCNGDPIDLQKLRNARLETTWVEVVDCSHNYKLPKQRRKREKSGSKNSPGKCSTEKTQHDGLKLPTQKGKGEEKNEFSIDTMRLHSFETFPKPTLRSRIYKSGYYYTGLHDETICHRCGATVKNWLEEDDPARFHDDSCEYSSKHKDMEKSESSGNTRNQVSLLDTPITEANSPMTSSTSSLTPSFTQLYMPPTLEDPINEDKKYKESLMEFETLQIKNPGTSLSLNIPKIRIQKNTKVGYRKQNARNHSSPISLEFVHFEDHKEFLKSLNLYSEEDRILTFVAKDKWKNNTDNVVDVNELASSGFFYLGNYDRTQCCSCGKVFKGWQRGDLVDLVHKHVVPYCKMISEDEENNVPSSTTSVPLHLAHSSKATQLLVPELSLQSGISEMSEISQSNQLSGVSIQQPPPEAMEFQSHPVQVTTEDLENPTETNLVQNQQRPLDLSINRSRSLNQRNLPTPEYSENALSWSGPVRTLEAQETVPMQTSLAPQSTPFVVTTSTKFRGIQPQSELSSSDEEIEEQNRAQTILQNPPLHMPQIPVFPMQAASFNAGASGMSFSSTSPQHSVTAITPSVRSAEPTGGSEWESIFPCENPTMPFLRSALARQETFDFNWPSGRMDAPVDDFARAGFFYVGQDDYVKCWYCGGQINNWNVHDDPWKEHARLYPTCEFLLQQKGPEFIHRIAVQNPQPLRQHPEISPLHRHTAMSSSSENSSGEMSPVLITPGSPRISIFGRRYYSYRGGSDPSPPPAVIDPRVEEARQREILQTALSSEDVLQAVEMGFDINLVRRIIKRKVRNSRSAFASAEQLMDALLNTTNLSSSSSSSESEMEMETTTPHVPAPTTTDVQPRTSTQASTSGATSAISLDPTPTTSIQTTASTSIQSSQSTSETLDPKELDEKLREYQIEKRCKVCLDKDAEVVFVPCGHLCTCMTCASALRSCPLCRKKIKKSMRTYTS